MTPELLSRQQVAQIIAELQQNVFDTDGAANYLQLSRQTLEALRVHGGGPPYVKLNRRVLYRRAALDEWLAAHERNHTAEG